MWSGTAPTGLLVSEQRRPSAVLHTGLLSRGCRKQHPAITGNSEPGAAPSQQQGKHPKRIPRSADSGCHGVVRDGVAPSERRGESEAREVGSGRAAETRGQGRGGRGDDSLLAVPAERGMFEWHQRRGNRSGISLLSASRVGAVSPAGARRPGNSTGRAGGPGRSPGAGGCPALWAPSRPRRAEAPESPSGAVRPRIRGFAPSRLPPSSALGTTGASCSPFGDQCQGCLRTANPSWQGLGERRGSWYWGAGGGLSHQTVLEPTSELGPPRTPVLLRGFKPRAAWQPGGPHHWPPLVSDLTSRPPWCSSSLWKILP